MDKIIKMQLKDGLGFPTGFVSPASYECNLYCKVPELWVAGAELKKEKEELILENMYGKSWRLGNGDGSFYVISSLALKVLSDKEIEEKIWLNDNQQDPVKRYWYYHVTDPEDFKATPVSDF